MKPKDIEKFRKACKEAGLKMECGPSDKTTKTPSAGVGMMVREDITFVGAEKKPQHSGRHITQAG